MQLDLLDELEEDELYFVTDADERELIASLEIDFLQEN
jgi:hypothetical protein